VCPPFMKKLGKKKSRINEEEKEKLQKISQKIQIGSRHSRKKNRRTEKHHSADRKAPFGGQNKLFGACLNRRTEKTNLRTFSTIRRSE